MADTGDKLASTATSALRAESSFNLKKKIEAKLKSSRLSKLDSWAAPPRGYWEPPAAYASPKAREQFYDGFSMYQRLPIREAYARWAIPKVLEEYKTGGFRIGPLEVPKGIIDAARAYEQQDIDAEDVTATKDTEGDVFQPIGARVQAVISASPNSLGPPVHPCARYLKMEKCGEYGQKKSTIWKSPFFPSLDNTDGRKGLLDHQITAIVWILSRFFGELPLLKFEDPDTGELLLDIDTDADRENRNKLRGPKYFGGILADSMGLGKTLVTIALLELLVRQKLNVVRDDHGQPNYHPILILVPNATLVGQWVDEIIRATDQSAIHKIVIAGDGIKIRKHQQKIDILKTTEFNEEWPQYLDFMWDQTDPLAAKSMIIISMDTWSSRTCKFVKDDGGGGGGGAGSDSEEESNKGHFYSTYTNLGRKFSIVVVDEAYKVKNAATRNWKSVELLQREFTLLVTATPCMNTLTDILGLARLLWRRPQKYLEEQQPDTRWDMQRRFRELDDLKKLDDCDHWNDTYLVAGRPALLAKMLYKTRSSRYQDMQLTRDNLKYFETLAILRRSSASHLLVEWDGSERISLEGLFPNVENYTVEMKLDAALDHEYQAEHIDLLIKYKKIINEWSEQGKSRKIAKKTKQSVMAIYRNFRVAAASLSVSQLERRLSDQNFPATTKNIALMRKAGIDFTDLAVFLQEPGAPTPRTALECIRLAVRKSPVLRYIFIYLVDNILDREEHENIKKLMIVEAVPMLAFYYELVLQLLGINCRVLHADLSNEARNKLIKDFNRSDPRSCQILVQMYTVGFTGTNLQKACSRVLVASQATSYAVQQQAIHRVIRVGQMSDVTVTRLMVVNSFHGFFESRQVEKLLPELSARANHDDINNTLVSLLNMFQDEVDKAWKTTAAQQLMASKNLLSDPDEEKSRMLSKKVKLEGGAASNASSSQFPTASDRESDSADNPLKRKHQPDSSDHAGNPHDGNHSMTDEEFLRLRTRNDYYNEFKDLPRESKSLFNHKKNMLRRLLSYGSPGGNATRRVWRAGDLDTTAVLERALELLIRVRLGAFDIAMLPHPQTELPRAPAGRRRELRALLGGSRATAQDFEAAGAAEARDGARQRLHHVSGADLAGSLGEIDRAFERDAVYGMTSARPSSSSSSKRRAGSYRAESPAVMVKGEDEADPDDDDGRPVKVKVEDGSDCEVAEVRRAPAVFTFGAGSGRTPASFSSGAKEPITIASDDDEEGDGADVEVISQVSIAIEVKEE